MLKVQTRGEGMRGVLVAFESIPVAPILNPSDTPNPPCIESFDSIIDQPSNTPPSCTYLLSAFKPFLTHPTVVSFFSPSHVLESLVSCALAPVLHSTLYIPSPECNAHTKEYPPNCLFLATCSPGAKAAFAAGCASHWIWVFAVVLLTLHPRWGPDPQLDPLSASL
ncbi:hypothetical protein BDV32DRAFT_43079 [Aspergillus pseudonomiae]|nr:hypothetical protein BDV32DRAFT_43079 [Aspergillus pseudonomiae]